MENYITVHEVESSGIQLQFKQPYQLDYQRSLSGMYFHESQVLDLYCWGESLEELKKNFANEIVVAWKFFVDCKENKLSNDAKQVRKALLELLR